MSPVVFSSVFERFSADGYAMVWTQSFGCVFGKNGAFWKLKWLKNIFINWRCTYLIKGSIAPRFFFLTWKTMTYSVTLSYITAMSIFTFRHKSYLTKCSLLQSFSDYSFWPLIHDQLNDQTIFIICNIMLLLNVGSIFVNLIATFWQTFCATRMT